MSSIGWSTLDVIPSAKGFGNSLQRQTAGEFAAAGRSGGRLMGDAASREAGSRIRTGLGAAMKSAIAPIAAITAGAGVAKFLTGSLDEAREAATVGRQTAAVLKATGGAANVTAEQIGNLSAALSKKVGVDDEAIQSGANLLLTFRNIKNEAGSGNDIFDQATQAILDVSTAMGQDLKSSAVQVGKALNDPIRGMTALQRVGVTFTEQQRAQVKALVASGDAVAAQKIILNELSKEFGGAAAAGHDATDRLGVAFKNLEEAAGTAALPAINALANGLTNQGIPALQAVGGAVGDAARGFASLPAPVKAATGALVAFRAAQALGVGSLFTGGASMISRGLDDVRLRAMSLTDEYKRLRQGQLDIIAGSGKLTPAAGRVASALGAIEVAAIGAGRGLKSGLSGAINLVGGPWGAAFIGAAAVVTHFWQENQKAKQRVKDFTAALDEQTGALTENNRQQAIDALQKSGAFDDARELGVGLGTLTDAALGSDEAIAQVTSHLDGLALGLKSTFDETGRGSNEMVATSQTIEDLRSAIGGQNDVVAEATQKWRDQREAMSGSADATAKTATAMRNYTGEIAGARTEVQKLLDVENKRRDANLGAFQDQTRLAQALADARKEAADGARTLSANAQAGRENRDALAGLADAWNSSANSVKNAKGAYDTMRQNFINVAESMGASETQAKKLADQLLGIPKKTPAEVTTPGMAAAIGRLKELNEQLRAAHRFSRINLQTQISKNRDQFADIQGRATGGMIYGRGTGTSDSNLIWASRGEFMQRKAAVDYYGVDFMRRLNALQVPRFAGGGLVGGAVAVAPTAPLGQEMVGTLRIVDGVAYIEGVTRAVASSEARGRRLSGLDGVRR